MIIYNYERRKWIRLENEGSNKMVKFNIYKKRRGGGVALDWMLGLRL